MRTLIHLVEQRRQLVNDKLRFTNRLGYALKQYYPQALAWFDQRDTPLFCDFLVRWPTLAQVKRAHRAGLERFFWNHHVRFANVVEERIRAIKAATALTTDEAVISVFRLQVQVLVEQLRTTLQAIDRFDRQIAKLAPTLPDYALFSALPGAGPHLAPRLLAAFGEQRERFASADELQRYSGIAPVTERSGKKNWVHWRWQCSTFLRQTPLSNGPPRRSTNPFGRAPSTANTAIKVALIKPPYAHLPTNGYESCIAAGKRILSTTK
jgi:hypothetical protein